MWQVTVHELVDKQLKATVCHEVLNWKDKVQQDSYTVIYMSSVRHTIYKLHLSTFINCTNILVTFIFLFIWLFIC